MLIHMREPHSSGVRRITHFVRVKVVLFLELVWPKIVASKNGLSERILLFYQRRSTQVDLEKMAEQSENLEQFPVKSLTDVLDKISMEHNTKPPVKYTLTASAKELFFKYSKPSEESQGASPSSCEGSKGSKGLNKLRNMLRACTCTSCTTA